MRTKSLRCKQIKTTSEPLLKFANKAVQTAPVIYSELPGPLRPQASTDAKCCHLGSIYHHPLYSHQLRPGNNANRPTVRQFADHLQTTTYLDGIGSHHTTIYVNNRHTAPSRVVQGANGMSVIIKTDGVTIATLNYEEVQRNPNLTMGAEYHLINQDNINHYNQWEVQMPDVIYKEEISESSVPETIDLRCMETMDGDDEGMQAPLEELHIDEDDLPSKEEARKWIEKTEEERKRKREELIKQGAISLAGKTTDDGYSLDGIYFIPPMSTVPSHSSPPSPSPMMNIQLKNKLKTTMVRDEKCLSISDIIDMHGPGGDVINAIISANEQQGLDETTLTIEGGKIAVSE